MITINGLPLGVGAVTGGKDKSNAGITGDGTGNFADQLKTALNKVNTSQVKANEITEKFLAGEVEDVHQVMIAMQEARLTMQLAVEVRNKLVETYQEISRMQV